MYRKLILLIPFAVSSLHGISIDRGIISNNSTYQTFYNSFGELLGRADKMRMVFDYGDYQTTAGVISNAAENFSAHYNYFKDGGIFIDTYKGLVIFADKFVGDIQYEFAVQEGLRKNLFSSYVLANNLLDGIFVRASKKDGFNLNLLYCLLRTNVDATAAGTSTTGSYENVTLIGEENNYLMGASLSLDILKAVKSDLFSIGDVTLSYAGTVHRDVQMRADMFNGSAPLTEAAFSNETYHTNIVLAITPYRSSTTNNFTALYAITADFGENGVSNIPVTTTDTDTQGRAYMRINEGTTSLFTIATAGITTKKQIKITMRIANSYYVQNVMGARLTFQNGNEQLRFPGDVVLSSRQHDIRDFSNYGDMSFFYGLPCANHNFGIEADLSLFGVSVETGFFPNLKIYQAPRIQAQYTYDIALAGYIEAKKELGPLNIAVAGFYCDADYQTELATVDRNFARPLRFYQVLDNENDNFKSPTILNRFKQTELYESPTNYSGDLNINSYPDFLEDFLMFKAYPQFFEPGDDFNNNGFVDVNEDDYLIDYRFHENLMGGQSRIVLTMMPGLALSLYGGWQSRVSVTEHTATVASPKLSYSYLQSDASVLATFAYKYVTDNIVDDVSSGTGVTLIESTNDGLNYQNSHVFDIYYKSDIQPFSRNDIMKSFFVRTILHAEGNYQMNNARMIFRSGVLGVLSYQIPFAHLFKNDTTGIISKNLGVEFNVMARQINRANFPFDQPSEFSELTLAGMTRVSYRLSKLSAMYAGYQYKHVLDFYSRANNYGKHSVAFEIDTVLKSLVLIAGVSTDYFAYSDISRSKYNGYNSGFFVRVMTKS